MHKAKNNISKKIKCFTKKLVLDPYGEFSLFQGY